MTHPRKQDLDLEPVLPLLRAIQREIDERRVRLGVVERWLETFAASRRAHAADIALLESERSTHRRALREVARELARLGLEFDADHPGAIVPRLASGSQGPGRMGETGFHHRLADSRA